MDFDQMILAHSQWKTKFRKLLSSPQERLDPEAMGKDDQCELGKWIHHEGTQHRGLGTYDELKAVHARFHLAAAEVIRLVNSGAQAKAEEMLEPLTGNFGRASSECISAIAALRNQLRS